MLLRLAICYTCLAVSLRFHIMIVEPESSLPVAGCLASAFVRPMICADESF